MPGYGVQRHAALAGNRPHTIGRYSSQGPSPPISFTHGDPQAWRAWWERHKQLLVPECDLRTTAGINVWLEAAAKAEPDVPKVLLKLWEFEPVIAETALIAAARTNPAARNVLAKLWGEGRLSVDARKTIVKNHLRFVWSK